MKEFDDNWLKFSMLSGVRFFSPKRRISVNLVDLVKSFHTSATSLVFIIYNVCTI